METISEKEQHEIIAEIQSSIDDNFYKLMECYKSMIYKIIHDHCHEYHIKNEYFDDLVQEGYFGIHNAAKSYDLEINIRFSTFVYLVIKRRVRHFYYKQVKARAQYSEYMRGFINESNCEYEPIYEKSTPHTIFMNNIDNKKIIQAYMRLSDIEKKILKSVIRKKSYKEISEETGLAIKQIDYKKSKIKRILKNSVKKAKETA